MTRPIRIHLVRTEWAHLGPHAGLKQYFDRLDRSAFSLFDRPTPFDDESIPRAPRRFHDSLRGFLRLRGMPWYTPGDLGAELHATARMLARRVDIVHFFDPEHGCQYFPLLLSRLSPWRRPRMVATFHQPPDMLPHILRRDVVSRLDHVTLVSPDQVPYFAECLPPERISMILHGVDTEFFRPAPTRPASGAWTCLTVGHNLRDFDTVRAVAERLRSHEDIRFVLVTPQRTGLEDLPNVMVLKGLSDEELRDTYQTADVLFLPLKGATANNAVLEALACGLPIVTTDLDATRAYAPGGEAVLVPANDAAMMAEALLAMRADPNRWRRLSVAARSRAEELRWDRIAPLYANMYQKVMSAARNGTG